MKGYKGFDKDLKCRGFQYEIGKTYEYSGVLEVCYRGFHFCENILDVFRYYNPSQSRFCEIEALGEIDKGTEDSKCATSKIKIIRELTIDEVIKCAIDYSKNTTNLIENKDPHSTSVAVDNSYIKTLGVRSISSNTNFKGLSDVSNYGSIAVNTHNNSISIADDMESCAVNTGLYSVSEAKCNKSISVNSGDFSICRSNETGSIASNVGILSNSIVENTNSIAVNTGHGSTSNSNSAYSIAVNTGDKSISICNGKHSIAINNGPYSEVHANSEASIGISLGLESKIKGTYGSWIILSEYNDYYEIIDIKCVKVDNIKIKENTFYKLKNGEIVEVLD